jgi:hypothetical protein
MSAFRSALIRAKIKYYLIICSKRAHRSHADRKALRGTNSILEAVFLFPSARRRNSRRWPRSVFVNHFTSQRINPVGGAILSSVGARPAPPDLFDLLESKPVWKIEELEGVLEISAKTLYKQAARGKLPTFKIGSCVRVYGKGLADHLRVKMKK